VAGEGKPLAVAGPGGPRVDAGAARQAAHVAAIRVHDVNLKISVPAGAESDPFAIRRKSRCRVQTGRAGHRLQVLSLHVHGGDPVSAEVGEAEHYPPAIGGYRRTPSDRAPVAR